MEKIAFLGSANALKPKIILEVIIHMNMLSDKTFFLFTDKDEGICVDFCKKLDIKIIKFDNLKLNDQKSMEIAKNNNIDLLISCGWPHKIPESFLSLFKYKSINCHGSILPDYRGSRAYMHYWANCEEFYGASIHYMNQKFDDGNLIAQGRLKLFMEETPEVLHRRTAELCAYLLPSAIKLVESGWEGEKAEGTKRYFEKLTPQEFIEYRKNNEQKKKINRTLTPHRIIT